MSLRSITHTIIFVLTIAIAISLAFSVSYAGGDAAAGKAVFEANCGSCHGMDGNAMIPGVPSFAKGEAAGGKKLADRSDADLTKSIKEGIATPSTPGAPPMPALGLSDGDIANVIAYIRTLKK